VRISTIAVPGAAFGEVAVLMDSDHSATVVAASTARLRYAQDGRAFLLSSPEVLLFLAKGLAARLDLVTRYLADLRNQYAGAPGLDMVSDVLGRLVQRDGPKARPGSARDPDPEY
jgi:CRP-like cAMP-binding protein